MIVGKDGYGFTPCGSTRQQRVEFAPAAQAVVDDHLDRGGTLEFSIEGHGDTRDGRLVMATLSLSAEAGTCDGTPSADSPDA